MQGTSLTDLIDEHLGIARATPSGRSSVTVYGGHEHALRQTLITLVAGRVLAEHESPAEASLHVLAGRIRLKTGADTWEGGPGDFLVIPADRHDVTATEDSATLLTVANNLRG